MKNFILSVPKPCHEKWESFNPTTLGGYCSSCQKEVIDFSTWDEDRIKQYFLQTQTKTCGRFRHDQLKSYALPGRTSLLAQKWIPVSLLSFTLLLTTPEARAQKKSAHPAVQQSNKPASEKAPDSITPKVIEGTVKSAEDSAFLPGVNVFLKGTTTGTSTDGNGKFSLTILTPSENDTLVFSFIGLETKKVAIYGKTNISVTLYADKTVLGESIVVGGICYRPWGIRSIWWRIKNLFRKN